MYTELDRLADGWRAAFGDAICKDINKELRKHNSVDTYKIVDIRAVNGRLLWISEGQSPWCQLDKIFDKYEKIAANTCMSRFFEENNLPGFYRIQDSMSHRAQYSTSPSSHESIGTPLGYLRYTSPIRRCSDYFIHIVLGS